MDKDLREKLTKLAEDGGFTAFAVAVEDYQHERDFAIEPDRWFHAASTIKVAVLLAVFRAVDEGRLRLDDPVHVRNRFLSVIDGSPYTLDRERDGDPLCQRRVGRSMKVEQLAHAMITRSSNLATNLLLDLVGVDAARETVAAAGLKDGIQLRRGVEDHVAYEKGINNEVTARGLVRLFGLVRKGEVVSEAAQKKMLEILLEQEFKSMIPAQLPNWTSVAHKTGEISTHCHDAGLVFVPNREPYAVAILTEGPPGLDDRNRTVAAMSEAIFQFLKE